MDKTALFIRHKAKVGQRENVQRVWEKHVKTRVEVNPGHLAYFFCHDESDPDVVRVFQLYRDKVAMKTFMAGDWYPEYLREISQFVAEEPQIQSAAAVWVKEYPKE